MLLHGASRGLALPPRRTVEARARRPQEGELRPAGPVTGHRITAGPRPRHIWRNGTSGTLGGMRSDKVSRRPAPVPSTQEYVRDRSHRLVRGSRPVR
ncbi:hypothetical protein GCM10010431_15940 [Streptomyces kunmingensis]